MARPPRPRRRRRLLRARDRLRELVSTFTDLWTGILMSLEFTVPALAILLALARVALYRPVGSKGADPAGAE